MWAIFIREVKAYFETATGYVYAGIFLFLSGLFFSFSISPQNPYTMPIVDYSGVMFDMLFTLLFVTPILTMRSLSEERRNGTDQLLFTSPVSLTGIIIGKYLAALFVFVCTLIITLIYPIILSKFASIDFLSVVAGYIGFFLIGAVFISIGIFVSSTTQSQTIAAIVSFCILLFLLYLEGLNSVLNLPEQAGQFLDAFLITKKFDQFALGLINWASVLFLLSVIFVFLFLTLRTIEKRRWSKG